VVRHIEERRDTTGLTGLNQRTVLTRHVRLFLSRLDAADGGPQEEREEREQVVLRERIPVSEVSAVEVKLRADSCEPRPDEVDAEGLVRWTLRPAPGERCRIDLVYDITATSAVTGL
jgi:hypothetical protein